MTGRPPPEFVCPVHPNSRLSLFDDAWIGVDCRHRYPIENGIPSLMPEELPGAVLTGIQETTLKERNARDAQARVYDWNIPLHL
ncbi:MAG: hypothetical protein ACREDG_07995, partial [Methylocella sp.]